MKDYCPNCSVQTNHEILFIKKIQSTSEEDFDWSLSFQTIQCRGCENIQFKKVIWDESMVSWDHHNQDQFTYTEQIYYPPNINGHRKLQNYYHIPEKIRIVYNESLEALKCKCYLLTGVGLRAVIEAICLEQNIVGRNLEVKINNLTKNKLITEKDSHRLHSVRFLGNDSVHEMEVPKETKIKMALNIVEHLINNLYLIDIDAAKHLDTIISSYDNFKKIVLTKFAKINVGEEKSIKEVLQKDYRRIENGYLANFVQELINEINNGAISIIGVGQMKNSTVENTPVQHFIKKEIPTENS